MPVFLHLSFSCNLDPCAPKPTSDVSPHHSDAGIAVNQNATKMKDHRSLGGSTKSSTADDFPLQNKGHTDSSNARRQKISTWTRNLLAALGVDDRRRWVHSMKAGLALGLVSMTVLLHEVYESLGRNVLWAVLTVVVVFEYTVGATLSKGLNRGLGTILAASLGLLFDKLANLSGPNIEPYIVGSSVFFLGTITTYTRFFPQIKAKYDYGVVMFLLTFCLVVVSGYRAPDNIDLVLDRMLTVLLGCFISVLVSLCVCPVWAGEDLHNLIVNNFEDLAGALEGCTREYFFGRQHAVRRSSKICKGEPHADPIYKGYRAVLISKQTEESLANFASWEPWHGRFGCSYPWKKCVEVGAILRHCAYSVCALHGCVLSEIQAPDTLRQIFAQSCMRISSEVVKVLREIADGLKVCRKSRSKESMMANLHRAVEQLHAFVEAHPNVTINPDGWPLVKTAIFQDEFIPTLPSDSDHPCKPTSSPLPLLIRPSISGTSNANLGSSCCMAHVPQECNPEITSESPVTGQSRLTSQKFKDFVEALSVSTVASLLIEIVSRVEPLLKAVGELEEQACFEEVDDPSKATGKPNLKRYKTEKLILQHSALHVSD